MKIIKNNQINNRVKVSILISTYNKGKFIENTLNSILNQTMDKHDFELIVVDDCSTDNTLSIVSSKIEAFSNYKLVQLDANSGTPAKPRNLAIDLSIGKYLMFIDGDDWLPVDSVEKLYKLMKVNKTDYATGLTKYVYNDYFARAGVALSKISQKKMDLKNCRKSFYHLAPHGRMIKADIIKKNHIRFPEMIFAEDLQFFAEVFFNINKLSTTQDVVYCTNRYTENVSLVKSKESTILNRIKLQTEAYRYLSNKYKDNRIFKKLLYRIINKDILENKFYKSFFIKEIDTLLPALQNILMEIEKDFNPQDFLDDELNLEAIKLIKVGDKKEIIKFVNWYLKKDKEELCFVKNKAYYTYNGNLYKKKIYAYLQKLTQKKGNVILNIHSRNADIKYLEVKSRKNPENYKIINLKKNLLKSGEYTAQFQSDNLPDGKLSLTVLDEDLNTSVIKTRRQSDFYETVNGNLGFIKK
ncbi:glycosyltransferase family 2 protein [Staphylococcus epidermidis]|uniref:glycosyltransferase family 2 protein n=1 Tax=Staphylococcus epidermidis TaxID=1282 RepID=UPI003D998EFD